MSKKDQVIKDAELYARMKDHLYSKKPVLGEGSPFSKLLQNMVNTVLEGEMDFFMLDQLSAGLKNKRNGKITKKVRTNTGDIWVETPRDRNLSLIHISEPTRPY